MIDKPWRMWMFFQTPSAVRFHYGVLDSIQDFWIQSILFWQVFSSRMSFFNWVLVHLFLFLPWPPCFDVFSTRSFKLLFPCMFSILKKNIHDLLLQRKWKNESKLQVHECIKREKEYKELMENLNPYPFSNVLFTDVNTLIIWIKNNIRLL